jgi:large subunit ribosomal protein L15
MTRKKKVRQRGHKTHGWGSKKKHRGGGSRGGRGRAGIEDHKRLMLRKKGIELGSRGFKTMKDRKLKVKARCVNVGDVERLAGDRKEIIIREFGYDKVTGKGSLSRPIRVIAKSFSARAQEKIEEAKGKAVLEE